MQYVVGMNSKNGREQTMAAEAMDFFSKKTGCFSLPTPLIITTTQLN